MASGRDLGRAGRPGRTFGRASFAVVGLLALAGCAGGDITHGYVLSDTALSQIQVGSSREQVLLVLGSPSTSSTIGGEAFYYITQKGRRPLTFMRESVVDQRVVAVYFDGKGAVQELGNYGLEDGKVVDFLTRKTKTGGRDFGIISQILKANPAIGK